MKYKILLTIVLIALLFSGCIGEESLVGKYVQIDDPRSYFNLYEDGTFNAFYSDGGSDSGTYRLVEGQLVLTYIPFGNVRKFTKNGTVWVKETGYKYVKE